MADDPPQPPTYCTMCGATPAASKCGVCKSARYCGRACQRSHWPEHKKTCHRPAPAPALTPVPAPTSVPEEFQGDCKPTMAEFETLESLGEGNFCVVHKVRHIASGRIFALKALEKQRVAMLAKRQHKNVHNEIKMEKTVLQSLDHPGVVKLFATFQDAQFCPGGELWSRLMQHGKPVGCGLTLARFYAAQIVVVLEYLRARHVVHRDLKPENVLLTAEGHVKLCDFGTAKRLNNVALNGPEFVGTPEYMSPEAIGNKKTTNTAADLWALGCMVFQMLTGKTPFQAGSPYLTFLKVQKGTFRMPSSLHPDAQDLVRRLLRGDPDQRLGAAEFAELKAHPFFAGVEWGEALFTDPPPERDPAEERLMQLALEVGATSDAAAVPAARERVAELPPHERDALRLLLLRMGKLKEPLVFATQFASSVDARFQRVQPDRCVLGYSQAEHGQWKDPFSWLFLSGSSQLAAAVARANAMAPKPAFVAYCPVDGDDREALNELDNDILVVIVPPPLLSSQQEVAEHRARYGHDFFGFWLGGVRFFVLNSSPLEGEGEDAEQQEWLAEEMETAKLCAHTVAVLQAQPAFVGPYDAAADEGRAARIEDLQDHKVAHVFAVHETLASETAAPPSAETRRKIEARASWDDDIDENEGLLHSVVTPVGAGVRVVEVERDSWRFPMYAAEELPAEVSLRTDDELRAEYQAAADAAGAGATVEELPDEEGEGEEEEKKGEAEAEA